MSDGITDAYKEARYMAYEDKLNYFMNTEQQVQVYICEAYSGIGVIKEVGVDFITIEERESKNPYVSIPIESIKYVRCI